MAKAKKVDYHRAVIYFWLGLIAGAIVVGLIWNHQSANLEDAILRIQTLENSFSSEVLSPSKGGFTEDQTN